jgi:hypothetical protein
MHDAFKVDLGALNALVRFSFLNYSVIVFLFCVLLMFIITVAEPRRTQAAENRLTVQWGGGGSRVFDRADLAWTGMVGCFVAGLWIHFR